MVLTRSSRMCNFIDYNEYNTETVKNGVQNLETNS